MIAEPAVLAAAQRRSRERNRAWMAGEARRAIDAAFAAVPSDDTDALAGVAATLIADEQAIAALLAAPIAALAEDPWHQPAIKASRDALRTGALLYEGAAAAIAATVIDAGALAQQPAPTTVTLSGKLSVTRYLRAGGGRLSRWQAPPVGTGPVLGEAPRCHALDDLMPADGTTLILDGRTIGHLLRGVRSDVVGITATLHAGAAPYRCEYAIDDGRLLRAAVLDERTPRTQLLLQLLRVQQRTDAAPRFAAATRDPSFELRWAAMREWLALDARAALPRLRAMAETDPHPEVHAAARATLPMVEERVACRG